jgi:hypothetical protein
MRTRRRKCVFPVVAQQCQCDLQCCEVRVHKRYATTYTVYVLYVEWMEPRRSFSEWRDFARDTHARWHCPQCSVQYIRTLTYSSTWYQYHVQYD